MLQGGEGQHRRAPEQALADAGYRSEDNFAGLAAHRSSWWWHWGARASAAPRWTPRYPRTAAMAAKLQTDEGKAAYRRRKWIAEPPNGWIKSVLGFRQFSLRGLHRVQAEFKLVCLALNLRRMAASRRRSQAARSSAR
jgi:hypothetical protein